MVGFKPVSTAIAAVSALAAIALADVDPIVIKGSKFFYKTNGTEFFIRGVAYQQAVGGNGTTDTTANYVDPLGDPDVCKRDIPYLSQLRTNTVRVYAIDPTKNHDECMTALQDAGIYVVADLGEPRNSIIRDSPAWDDGLYARYTGVVDTMAKYPNTLGFFAGNEVADNITNAPALPFVKAAVRDMKSYIKRKGYRPIGVGYAADDGAGIRVPVRDYVNCGPASDSVDFFGYNIYSWCGKNENNKLQTSGYRDRAKDFSDYNVPVFFAEYGCNVPAPRPFDDTVALYSDELSKVFSGGIVYEYFQEENEYGLVEVDGSNVKKLQDFNNLQKKMASIDPSGVEMGSYNPTNTQARDCPPTSDSKVWSASSKLPPTPNQELCDCMVSSLSCVAKKGLSSKAFKKLFDAACTKDVSCDGILADGKKGAYGAYSMCKPIEKLSWAFNNYYEQTGKKDTSCDFDGNAETQTSSSGGDCGNLIDQAGGAAGTGTVTSVPTAAGSGAAASSSGVAAGTTVPQFSAGLLTLGAYVVVAALTGAGMILL